MSKKVGKEENLISYFSSFDKPPHLNTVTLQVSTALKPACGEAQAVAL